MNPDRIIEVSKESLAVGDLLCSIGDIEIVRLEYIKPTKKANEIYFTGVVVKNDKKPTTVGRKIKGTRYRSSGLFRVVDNSSVIPSHANIEAHECHFVDPGFGKEKWCGHEGCRKTAARF